MSASFPSSVKSFTTKLAGDTIQPAHLNDVQAEITAIETAMIGGTLPAANGSALTALNATQLTSGIVPDARIPGLTTDGTSKVLGVAFHATQTPSSDVNTLDDYEEGTWTPTFGGSGGQSGQAYGAATTGAYVKVGKLVTASANIVLSTLGTITGNVQIKGLPFTSASGMTGMVHVGYWTAFTTAYVYLGGVVNASNTTATLYGATAAATGTTTLAQANLAATSEVWVTVTYLAAA